MWIFIKEDPPLSERETGPIPALFSYSLPFYRSTLQANVWSSSHPAALQPLLEPQPGAKCTLWHQWDSGRRRDLTARYRERRGERRKGSGVGAPLKGCISSDESSLNVSGAAPAPFEPSCTKWGGQAFYIALALCRWWARGQAGHWWIWPESSKLNPGLFQRNFYKVTPADVFFILKQAGYFNRD